MEKSQPSTLTGHNQIECRNILTTGLFATIIAAHQVRASTVYDAFVQGQEYTTETESFCSKCEMLASHTFESIVYVFVTREAKISPKCSVAIQQYSAYVNRFFLFFFLQETKRHGEGAPALLNDQQPSGSTCVSVHRFISTKPCGTRVYFTDYEYLQTGTAGLNTGHVRFVGPRACDDCNDTEKTYLEIRRHAYSRTAC